jgi:hypothetical protein
MAPHRDFVQVDRALREGLRARLAVEMGQRLANAWLVAWEAEAGARERDGNFWLDGYKWIAEQRRAGRRTPE